MISARHGVVRGEEDVAVLVSDQDILSVGYEAASLFSKLIDALGFREACDCVKGRGDVKGGPIKAQTVDDTVIVGVGRVDSRDHPSSRWRN